MSGRRGNGALTALALAGALAAGGCAATDGAGGPAAPTTATAPSSARGGAWGPGMMRGGWNGWASWGPGTTGGGPSTEGSSGPGMMGGDRDSEGSWGPGMMGGGPDSGDSSGPGMMGGRGTGGGWGPGMMGHDYWLPGDGHPVRTLADARRRADGFASRLGLRVGEVMWFSRNFYAELRTADGKPATEVLVDPADGDTGLEYGPAMMWNTTYGMAARGDAAPRISAAQAGAVARAWLRAHDRTLTVGEAVAYPGYYTLHTLKSGRISGMLSVDAVDGAVWNHTWHGTYRATDGS